MFKVIQCQHDNENLEQETPNYYPLTTEEIAELLEEARTSTYPLTSKIMIRLCQGIPGYVCPQPTKGSIAEKVNELNSLYISNHHKGADPGLVKQLYEIMNR